MKLQFYYVRHGKTLFNTIGRMQGSCDSPLTEEGIRKAKDVASALCHVHFDRAYCSSAERARDTAEILLANRNIKAVPMKGLKEFSYGDYDGILHAKIRDRLQREYFNDDWTDVNGENEEMFAVRVQQAFDRIVKESKDGETILIVSHGSFFIHLLKVLLNYDREEYVTRMRSIDRSLMPNTGIAMFEYEDGVFRLTREPITADEYRKIYEPKHVNFVYVRHGQTVFNTQDRMQGSSDSPLTEQGIAQAKARAEKLKGRHFDRAYTSPSERAIDTAAILLEGHGLEAVEDKRLHEVNFGTFEGSIQSEHREEIMQRHMIEEWSDVGGENKAQVEARLASLLQEKADEAKDGDTVLLVGHGALYLNLVEMLGTTRAELFERAQKTGTNPMPNCGQFEFCYDSETGYNVISFMNEL